MIKEITDTKRINWFEKIVELIRNQIEDIIETDIEYYGNYTIEVTNEQFYVDNDTREPNTIFVVVKFSPGEINFDQEVIPLTIQAVTEKNGIEACQKLLFDYSRTFDLKILRNEEIGGVVYQYYTTPNISNNFEVIYEGFRSVVSMSGTILVSENVNRMSVVFFEGESFKEIKGPVPPVEKQNVDILVTENDSHIFKWDEEQSCYVEYEGILVDCISLGMNYDASPDSQPYFAQKNFSKSIIKYGTLNFHLVAYLIKNEINNKALKVVSKRLGVDTDFLFKITFDEISLNLPLTSYKLMSFNADQTIAEIPTCTMAFSM